MRQFYKLVDEAGQPLGASRMMESFLSGIVLLTISVVQKCELYAPTSREEALKVLRSLDSGKVPGPDGLSSEIYRVSSNAGEPFPVHAGTLFYIW